MTLFKNKNILEVAYNWPPETFILRHWLALQAANYPVQMVTRHAHTAVAGASLGEAESNLRALLMPNFNHLAWAKKLVSLRWLTGLSIAQAHLPIGDKVLLGYFEQLRPTLIHFHDATLAATMAWIPATLGIPYTLSLRGSDVQVHPLQSAQQKAEIVAALDGAKRIHAVCEAIKLRASELCDCAGKTTIIYTPIPIPIECPAWNAPLPGQPLQLVTTGRLMWRKGFANLLQAVRALHDAGVNAQLTIVGVGPGLDELLYLRQMLRLEDAVHLPGKLPYPQIQQLFGQAHGYVQSSVAEGLSNSLAEAMVSGLPVFATDVDGTAEAVQTGSSGFLLPPLHPQTWAETLTKLYDTALMEKIRASAYERAKQLFLPAKHAQAFQAFWNEVS